VPSVYFGVSNPTELNGESVTIFIEKPMTGNTFDTNTDGAIQSGERQIAAFGTYSFTGTETANALFPVSVEDFNTGGIFHLEDNTPYIVVVQFTPSNSTVLMRMMANQEFDYSAADFAAGLAGVERYSEILDVGNSGTYSTAGFVGSPIPAVRMATIKNFINKTVETVLPETALTVFPNPADEFITATLEFAETAENVTIGIYNIHGQLVETRNLSNVRTERVMFNLDNYATGSYIMTITSDLGNTAKRFIVKK
jgi:hypothetical protein